jgi:arginase
MIGLRSSISRTRHPCEHKRRNRFTTHAIDEAAFALYGRYLAKVAAADGLLHVSLDVDFLDPDIAPAVGTTDLWRDPARAHLVMELLHDARVTAGPG